jgi:hypothetical protein
LINQSLVQVTDSLIAALARNVGRRLRSLSIANCPNMTDAALVFLSLSYCPRLEEVCFAVFVID